MVATFLRDCARGVRKQAYEYNAIGQVREVIWPTITDILDGELSAQGKPHELTQSIERND